jgi:hypothetical protein
VKQLGYDQVSPLSAAVGLAAGSAILGHIPTDARYALIQAESQDVRWTDDGSPPTTSLGHVLAAGQSFLYDLGPLGKLKFIETAASAKLNVTYYR